MKHNGHTIIPSTNFQPLISNNQREAMGIITVFNQQMIKEIEVFINWTLSWCSTHALRAAEITGLIFSRSTTVELVDPWPVWERSSRHTGSSCTLPQRSSVGRSPANGWKEWMSAGGGNQDEQTSPERRLPRMTGPSGVPVRTFLTFGEHTAVQSSVRLKVSSSAR